MTSACRADRQAQTSAAPVASFSEAYKAGAPPAPRKDILNALLVLGNESVSLMKSFLSCESHACALKW